ncbi:MAG: DUF262 domain-containing protein [Bacteroidota bacterium]
MDNSPGTQSIKKLVEEIDAKNIVLPDFQRDFVWDKGKSLELFDSLARDVFIGTIIFGVPSFDIAIREIDNRPRKQRGKRRRPLKRRTFSAKQVNTKVKVDQFRLILDGQQRITSLYRALKGGDEIYFVMAGDDDLTPEILNKPINERSLEELLYAFSSKEDPVRISILLSDSWKIIQGEIQRERDKIRLLKASAFYEGRGELNEAQEEIIENQFLIGLERLEDLIKGEKLLSYYLLDTTEQKFALFFERSNSLGIRLSFIDILTAKLYAGFKLRDKKDDYNKNSKWKLNVQVIVRSISYIVSHGKNVEQSFILKELEPKHFNEHWDDLTGLYTKTLDWLENNHLIVSQAWLPYENLLIALILFLRKIPSQDFSQISERQSKVLKYWYWAAAFSQRYSRATGTMILEDGPTLERIATEEGYINRSWVNSLRPLVSTEEDVLNVVGKSSIYIGIINLINFAAQGLLDWSNSDKLHSGQKLEEHHIFPRKYLKDQYPEGSGEREYINSVANKALIPKITNIKISDKKPSEYLNAIKDKKNPKLADALRSHQIFEVEKLLQGNFDQEYFDFLMHRSILIMALIKQYVFDLKQDLFPGVNGH